MKFIKKSFIASKQTLEKTSIDWDSHIMAPTAIYYEQKIRVFFGGWDKNKVSRIYFIDLDPKNLTRVINFEEECVLDIGEDGHFDENGVFPGHIHYLNNKLILSYTGFQLGQKIRHYNFGGLAVNTDSIKFTRISKAPILDRSDEGLLVRAGQSFIEHEGCFHHFYSSGSSFVKAGTKSRPCYDIYYQKSDSIENLKKEGLLKIKHNTNVEHGLGRPQIIKIKEFFYLFYTRRMLNMKYFVGCSRSKDLDKWENFDSIFDGIKHQDNSFDSDMIYFPTVFYNPVLEKFQLIYCGNNFGESGIGYMELSI